MRRIHFALFALLCSSCDGFLGESKVEKPDGPPPIQIVDPNYVVLRPVSAHKNGRPFPAKLGDQTFYFHSLERIIDLRHLDPRTAKVEEGPMNTYVVTVRTTAEGDQLVREWTSPNLENLVGVFVDQRLAATPILKSKIIGVIVLDGGFSKPQAEAVVARLRRGGAA